MASSRSTWRRHVCQIGAEYEVRDAFAGASGAKFIPGRRYVLQHIGYSAYDSSTVFRFQARDEEPLDWWWHDDEPEMLPPDRFRLA